MNSVRFDRGAFRIARDLAFVGIMVGLGACTSSSEAPPTTAANSKALTDAADRLNSASAIAKDFRAKVPDSVARDAQCVAVVPGLVKGGLIVGGRAGKGYVTCRTNNGWSPPGPISIAGGSIGAQIGVESTDVLMLAMNEQGKQAFYKGDFKVGGDVSAAAGPVGTGRGSTSDIVSYTRAKGLFAGAELSGAGISGDKDTTVALYGQPTELRDILMGQAAMPQEPSAQRFIREIRHEFGRLETSSR
jgi:lipid-binding SYLF domain-containing protein